MHPLSRRILPLYCLILLPLGACKGGGGGDGPEAAISNGPAPELEPPLEAIARWQDARSDGAGRLERMALEGDDEVRERATVALGRLPLAWYGAKVTDTLALALEDRSPRVRAAAAFGLGQRGDPAAIEPLRGAWDDALPEVRARVVEAASKLAANDESLREEILFALFSDVSYRVRIECAVAPSRWSTQDADALAADEALANSAMRLPPDLQPTPQKKPAGGKKPAGDAGAEVPEVCANALFALARRAAERRADGTVDQTPARVREAFLTWSTASEHDEARIFAVMGLSSIPADPASSAALVAALADPDWRVACEAARGLGKKPDLEALPALEHALSHSSTHVRQESALALGHYAEAREHAKALLERGLADRSANVRASAVEASARLLGDGYAVELSRRAVETDPRLRAAAVGGTAFLDDGLAVPMLSRLTADENPFVAFSATEALGDHLTPTARQKLHALLLDRDTGLRLAAVNALEQAPVEEDLAPLETAWTTSRGDITDELQAAIVKVAAQIGGERAAALCARGLESSRAYVRIQAHDALKALLQPDQVPPLGPPPPRAEGTSLPAAPLRANNPVVEITTTKGSLVVVLYADVAPIHVHNFLELASEDHYDGLRFHRVVPDFVVQGGDYRGDGNGGVTWRGEPLRHEFSPRKYVHGSLGMPRNDDVNSGGSQVFFTHRATPRLDGRYTLFGQIQQGLDVLDVLEVGDQILDVKVRGSRARGN